MAAIEGIMYPPNPADRSKVARWFAAEYIIGLLPAEGFSP
jgi:hypothetical protein